MNLALVFGDHWAITRRLILAISILFNPFTVIAAEGLPNHDIVLFDLQNQQGKLILSNPEIIAASAGYDNQPQFSQDGNHVYFTRIEDGNADMWVWSMQQKSATVAVKTSLSEYSPTPIPTLSGFLSTVVVEADNTQRLWKYHPDEGFSVIFDSVKPVGYHVWSDDYIGLFVLGEPHQLQVTRLGEQSTKVIDEKIGRCLQKLPAENAISYTVAADNGWLLKRYDIASGKITPITLLPAGGEDYVWYSSDHLISSNGNQLLHARLNDKSDWQILVNSTKFELTQISRLALSPDKTKLAVVFVNSPSLD